MCEKEYFVRFVLSTNQARRDLRRGYSFSQYVFHRTKAEAIEFWHDLGIENPQIGRCKHGFGLRLAGLCGFGPFETIDEAREYVSHRHGYNGVSYPVAAIYEGRYAGQADAGDGDMFTPRRLVDVIELDN